MPDLKCHSMFYMALGRLLNLDFSDDDETFDQFIKPLSSETPELFSELFEKKCSKSFVLFQFFKLDRLNRIGQMMSESQNNSNSLNEIKVDLSLFLHKIETKCKKA